MNLWLSPKLPMSDMLIFLSSKSFVLQLLGGLYINLFCTHLPLCYNIQRTIVKHKITTPFINNNHLILTAAILMGLFLLFQFAFCLFYILSNSKFNYLESSPVFATWQSNAFNTGKPEMGSRLLISVSILVLASRHWAI